VFVSRGRARPPEQVLYALALREAGGSISSIATQCDLPRGTVARWCRGLLSADARHLYETGVLRRRCERCGAAARTAGSFCARVDPVRWLARSQPRTRQGSRLRVSALSVLESLGRHPRVVHRHARRTGRRVAAVGPVSHLGCPSGIGGAPR